MSLNDVRSGKQTLARTPYIDRSDHVDNACLHLYDVWVVEDFIRDAQMKLARKEGWTTGVILAADCNEAVDGADSTAATFFSMDTGAPPDS